MAGHDTHVKAGCEDVNTRSMIGEVGASIGKGGCADSDSLGSSSG